MQYIIKDTIEKCSRCGEEMSKKCHCLIRVDLANMGYEFIVEMFELLKSKSITRKANDNEGG